MCDKKGKQTGDIINFGFWNAEVNAEGRGQNGERPRKHMTAE